MYIYIYIYTHTCILYLKQRAAAEAMVQEAIEKQTKRVIGRETQPNPTRVKCIIDGIEPPTQPPTN